MSAFPKTPALEGVLGYVTPGSAAAQAGLHSGDRIVAIDGKRNPTWQDILEKESFSANRPLLLLVRRGGEQLSMTVTPALDERNGLGSAGWQEQGEVQVAEVVSGMPAEDAGIQEGDVLLRANGQSLRSQYRLNEVIRAVGGKPVQIEYERDGRERTVWIQPVLKVLEKDKPARWLIGVTLSARVETVQLAFPDAFRESVRQNLRNATLIVQFLKGLVERRMSPKSIEGPIGLARMARTAAHQGPYVFLGLMAMVSLNLAVFNLLPIPILDGGVILVLAVEMLMRRDLSLRFKETVFKLGFVFLMAVMAFVLYNDIAKI
jgi:regulator of sigma E protease